MVSLEASNTITPNQTDDNLELNASVNIDVSSLQSRYDTVISKLDALNNYSTDEIDTGMTWTDGKPIYRKVYTSNYTVSSSSVITSDMGNVSSLDIDTLTRFDVTVSANGGSYHFNVDRAHPSNFNYQMTCWIRSDGSIRFEAGKSMNAGTAWIILEYTKS